MSLNTVADNRLPHFFADSDAESILFPLVEFADDDKMVGVNLSFPTREIEKLRSSGKAGVFRETFPALRQLSAPFYERARFGGTVTVSLLRPLDLLCLRTLRPPGVAIRVRKPWVLFRFILLG